MSDRKPMDRRRAAEVTQERSDLNVAITELHQTIARLNKVIDQVKTPEQQMTNGTKQESFALDLANIKIPKTLH